MSHTRIAFLLTWGTMACLGQGSFNTATINGVNIRMEWKAEPANPEFDKAVGGVLVKDVIQRHLGSMSSRKYSGYDLTADPLPDGRYRLTFSALSLEPEVMSKIFKGEWTLVPMPRQPFTQVVSPGDVLALDLFVNRTTGHKIVDYIQVGARPEPSGQARDFGLDDLEWTIASPKVKVNASVVDSTGSTIVGCPPWLYLKGHGRFVFSLRPRQDLGFQKAGEIRGANLTWAADGKRYAVETASNIIPGNGVFNLYVFHSRAYRPAGGTAFEMGAGGKLESLVRP